MGLPVNEATGRTVRIDTHLHTTASYDGETLPEELLRRAEAVGLDGVVVTDHDTVDGAHAVADLAAESSVTAIVGCEVSTADGHLLAIGVEDAPPAGDPLAETAERVRKAGGVAVVPHPFQRSRHGANATTIDDVDGVEVYNAHTLVNFRNEQAERYARRHGYPAFGGSDAHRPSGIGLAATEVQLEPGAACTPEAVVAAMRAGRTAAVGRRTSAWQYVRKLVANARSKTPSLR
ncbi:PHP domain-containing protein [Haloarcula sp. JP-L23]|nr:PHP domain-containing protein [Haloarcula sp. JP-L23]